MVPEKKLPFSGGSASLPVPTFGTKELRQCLRSRGRVHRWQRGVKHKSWRAMEVLRDETLSKICHLSLKTKSPYLGTKRRAIFTFCQIFPVGARSPRPSCRAGRPCPYKHKGRNCGIEIQEDFASLRSGSFPTSPSVAPWDFATGFGQPRQSAVPWV